MKRRLYFKTSIFVVFIMGVILRFYHSASQSLWLDESATYDYAQKSFNFLLTDLSFEDPHSPLYYIIVKCFTALFGNSEFSLRFPSIIFGCLSLFAIYALSRELFNRRVAFVTIFLSSFNFFQVYYSQDARMYSMLMFFGVVSTYFLFRFIKTRRTKYLIVYTLSTIVLGYVHLHSFFVIATHNIFVFYLYAKSWNIEDVKIFDREEFLSLRKWLVAQVSIFLILLPWISVIVIRAYNRDSPGWLDKPEFVDIISNYGAYFGYNGASVLIILFIVLFISLGVVSQAKDEKHRPALLLMALLCILPVILPFIISHIISPIFFPRYTIVASIPVIILVSKGIVDGIKKREIYAIIALVFVFLSCISTVYYYDTTKSEWGESVQYVEENISQKETVIIGGYNKKIYDYYSTRNDYDIRIKGNLTNSSIKDIIRENEKLYLFRRLNSLKQNHKSLIEENYNLEKRISYEDAPLEVYQRSDGRENN